MATTAITPSSSTSVNAVGRQPASARPSPGFRLVSKVLMLSPADGARTKTHSRQLVFDCLIVPEPRAGRPPNWQARCLPYVPGQTSLHAPSTPSPIRWARVSIVRRQRAMGAAHGPARSALGHQFYHAELNCLRNLSEGLLMSPQDRRRN